MNEPSRLKFIDLFSGIGGFRLAFEKLNHKCVFSADNDKYSCETYYKNFKEKHYFKIQKYLVIISFIYITYNILECHVNAIQDDTAAKNVPI